MQALVQNPAYSSGADASGRQIFLQSGQYHTCHIRVPDATHRLPALVVNGQFYSFFKAVNDREKALDIRAKLFDKGELAVITQTPKAYAVWVLESTACIDRPSQN